MGVVNEPRNVKLIKNPLAMCGLLEVCCQNGWIKENCGLSVIGCAGMVCVGNVFVYAVFECGNVRIESLEGGYV